MGCMVERWAKSKKKKKDVRQTRLAVYEIAEPTQPRAKPNLFLVPWAAVIRGLLP